MGCVGTKSVAADGAKASIRPQIAIRPPSEVKTVKKLFEYREYEQSEIFRSKKESEKARELFEFIESEEAEVYSFGKDRWFPCVIKAVYLADTVENGSMVPKNTIKVEFAGGTKYIQASDIEAELRKKGSAWPAPCRSPRCATRDRGEEPRSLHGFTEGDCVEIWSHSKGEWISCFITAVYLSDTLEEEYIVPEKTIKVESANGVKYVRSADIPFALRHSAADHAPMEIVHAPPMPALMDSAPVAMLPDFYDSRDRLFYSPCRSPAASVANLQATEAALEAIFPPSAPWSEVIDMGSRSTTKAWQAPSVVHSLPGQPVDHDPREHSRFQAPPGPKLVISRRSVDVDFSNPNWFNECREKLRSAGIGEGAPGSRRSSTVAVELLEDSGQRDSDASVSPRSAIDVRGLDGMPAKRPPSSPAQLKELANDKKPRASSAEGGRSGQVATEDKNSEAAPRVSYAWGDADRADQSS